MQVRSGDGQVAGRARPRLERRPSASTCPTRTSSRSTPPRSAQTRRARGVGTTLFNMAVNPVSGEALRLEHRVAQRGPLRGPRHLRRQHRAGPSRARRASPCCPTGAGVLAAPSEQAHRLRAAARAGRRRRTTAWRRRSAWRCRPTARRSTSRRSAPAKIGVFDTAALENDTFDPTRGSADYISRQRRRPERPRARRGAQPALRPHALRQRGRRSSTSRRAARRSTSRCTTPSRPASSQGRPFLYDARQHVQQRRGVVRELPHLRRHGRPRLGSRQPRRRRDDQPDPDQPRHRDHRERRPPARADQRHGQRQRLPSR